jgi:hypothetical protein
MVFNATFNNISDILWQSVLLVEETGVSSENHQYFLEFLLITVYVILSIMRHCRDRMVVGFTTTHAISAYQH